ncbi:MAG: superoxide dismutase, Ni [Pseudomonadota bacterium]
MRRWFQPRTAEAHCDIPCGIYDPTTAQIAAISVARFLDQIAELEPLDSMAKQAKLARLVAQKEQHAAEVKDAVVVIWGDYFKAPQFEEYPELHTLTHSILMKASATKQELSVEHGRELVALVNEFAEIFWKTKGIAVRQVTVAYEPKLTLAQPIFDEV